MSDRTPKQIAWNATKAEIRTERTILRTLRHFGVPRRLRSRFVRVRQENWWTDEPRKLRPRVTRGRASNPTVLR